MLGSAYRFYLSVLSSTRKGDERVEKALRFDNHVIANAGDEIHARFELLNANLMLGTRLYVTPGMRLEILVGGMYIHVESRIVNETRPNSGGITSFSSSDKVNTAGLYAGLDGHIAVTPRFTLFGRILVSSYTANLFDLERFSYFDSSIGVTYSLFGPVSLMVDFRRYRLALVHEKSGTKSVYEIVGTGIGIAVMISF